MKRLLLFTLLVLNSGPAYADWVKVSDGDEAGKTVYVDPATIRRNSNLVKMWQFYDYKTVQTMGGIRFLSAKEQWEFDCAEGRSRVVARKEFSDNMGSGTMVSTNSQIGKWVPVMPGSIGQTVWKAACSRD
ncbi:MAG TPA: surface-adhesin E family protein [Nitrospiraceae bacterium]|nr:surface-adhesin E family protein [Nitrospiraceae bacterium]